jgi:hypothetical protein
LSSVSIPIIYPEKFRRIGAVLFIDDEGRLHAELRGTAADTVQKDHVRCLVHVRIDQTHALRLQSVSAESGDDLGQAQGAVDQVKMAAR